MDELTIDGKIYVSSKRAAAITGYAKDYVGQLCREGRVEAKLVGRSWYVYEPSLKKHRFSEEEEIEQPKAVTAWGGASAIGTSDDVHVSEKANIQAVWDAPAYMAEEVKTLPELEEEPVTEIERPLEPSAEPLSDMQSAWQEWFSARGAIDESRAPLPPEPQPVSMEESAEEPVRMHIVEPQNMPLRTVVSDIAPIQRSEEPIRHAYAPVYVPAQPVPARTNRKGRGKGGKISRRVLQAVFIAVIAVSASVALVSTGLIDSLHIGGTSDANFVRFLEGENVVEK